MAEDCGGAAADEAGARSGCGGVSKVVYLGRVGGIDSRHVECHVTLL